VNQVIGWLRADVRRVALPLLLPPGRRDSRSGGMSRPHGSRILSV
jgi:hypothetical protein